MKIKDSFFNFIVNFIVILTATFLLFMLYSINHMYEVHKIREAQVYRKMIRFSASLYGDYDLATIDWSKELEWFEQIDIGNWFCVSGLEVGVAKELCDATVFVHTKEERKYVLEEGAYWEEGTSLENTILIGTGLLNRTYMEGEKRYLNIYDEKCYVIGVLADASGSNTDCRIIMDCHYLTEKLAQQLLSHTTEWGVVSDYSDILEYTDKMCSWYGSIYHCLSEYYEETDNYDSSMMNYLEKLLILLAGFAIYNAFLISKLLFERYKRNLIIMRMFGMSAIQILFYFYKKIWLCYLVALVLVLFFSREVLVLLLGIGVVLAFILATLIPVMQVLFKRSIRGFGTDIFEVI